MLDETYRVERSKAVEPHEIMDLRSSVGWSVDDEDTWRCCVEQALSVVTAREQVGNALIGIGFVVGNARHAQLVDITVHPRAQRRGVATSLQAEQLAFCKERSIKYVGLTWDTTKPWLHEMYSKSGFRDIDFAMQHESST